MYDIRNLSHWKAVEQKGSGIKKDEYIGIAWVQRCMDGIGATPVAPGKDYVINIILKWWFINVS